ncbi:MAG: hypothetical protein WD226_05700 [Planctomycetota bacterium]
MRAPLAPLVHVGPRADATLVEQPAASGDAIAVTQASLDFRLENTRVQAGRRAALMFYERSGLHRGVRVVDTELSVEPGTLELDRAYWGVRAYDLVDAVFERVEITGFGVVTDQHDEGHAVYLNPLGDVAFLDCHFHHNGGQAIQLVRRPTESVEPEGPAPGTITVARTRLAENGFNPDRGAFQLSIFGTGQDVTLTDVEIIAGHDPAVDWPGGLTGGALLIESDGFQMRPRGPNTWWRPAELPADFEAPFTTGRAELTRLRIHHKNPNRPVVQIKGCRELLVTDSEFAEGDIHLDLPRKPGRENGSITWTGNRGEARVFWRGDYVGPAWQDFQVRGGKLQRDP